MKKTLIILPYANPHLGLFYNYAKTHLNCDFYIRSSATHFRKHVIVVDQSLSGISYIQMVSNYFKGRYALIIEHGVFHPFTFFLFIGTSQKLFAISERLNTDHLHGIKKLIKRKILQRLYKKHQLEILLTGNQCYATLFTSLANRQIAIKEYGYFPDWKPIKNQKSASEGKVRIVYAGQLISRKNIEMMLTAAAISKSINAGLTEFILIGDGPLAQKVSQAKCVTHMPTVDKQQLLETLCQTDIIILASNYEGWGAIVNEAAACGCAILATSNIPSSYLFVKEGITGMAIEHDPADIANKFDYLEKNREILNNFKRNISELYADIYSGHDSLIQNYLSNATTGYQLQNK